MDIGSTATKAVIFKDGRPVARWAMPTGVDQRRTAQECLDAAIATLPGLPGLRGIVCLVATGYGRSQVAGAQRAVTEITCHARGARMLVESARLVVDIGGQDSKVIRLDDNGMVADFIMNDKCAAGTGRFLEVMADRLGVPLSEFGRLWRRAREAAQISSTCTVFAESEVVSLLSRGVAREPIIRGLCDAVADRLVGMVRRVGLVHDVVMTGGVSQNEGMRLSLAKKLGAKVIVPEESQFAGAFGAAVIAWELAEADSRPGARACACAPCVRRFGR